MLTDVQTPFLGTPFVPLKHKKCNSGIGGKHSCLRKLASALPRGAAAAVGRGHCARGHEDEPSPMEYEAPTPTPEIW